MKKFFSLLLLFSLISTSASIKNNTKNSLAASAATPMPTKINMTTMSYDGLVSYYEPVEGKKGDALLGSLYTIIKDHNEYDYENDTHRTIYKIIDRNWTLSPLSESELNNFDYAGDNGYIRKLYADYNDDITRADRFKNDGASRVSFDKEHVWAQSLGDFGRKYGAGSDFHHLLPSDVKGNQNAHSNYGFGVPVTGIKNYNNDKGTYVGRSGYLASGGPKVFEPLDEYKGDIARAMFYMVARYYEYSDSDHPKLELVNGSPYARAATAFITGQAGDLATLLEWNKLDPVDEYEIKRNNLIYYNYQGNRNPFVDFPHWADIAFSASYTGPGVEFNNEPTTSEPSNPGTSIPETSEPGVENKTVTKIEVTIKEGKTFLWLSSLKRADFIVTATYSDDSTATISDYTFLINDVEGTLLSTQGKNKITIEYTKNNTTVKSEFEIEVVIDTIHYVVGASIAVVLLTAVIILLVKINKSRKLKKKAVKVAKKVTKAVKKKKK